MILKKDSLLEFAVTEADTYIMMLSTILWHRKREIDTHTHTDKYCLCILTYTKYIHTCVVLMIWKHALWDMTTNDMTLTQCSVLLTKLFITLLCCMDRYRHGSWLRQGGVKKRLDFFLSWTWPRIGKVRLMRGSVSLKSKFSTVNARSIAIPATIQGRAEVSQHAIHTPTRIRLKEEIEAIQA